MIAFDYDLFGILGIGRHHPNAATAIAFNVSRLSNQPGLFHIPHGLCLRPHSHDTPLRVA